MRTTKHTAILLPLTVVPLPYMILPSIILPPFETATPASFTVETTVLPSLAPRTAARFVTWEGSSSSHVPSFSCEAASLLDAMAAVPRKWVSGGLRLVAYASESALPLDKHDPFFNRAAAFHNSG